MLEKVTINEILIYQSIYVCVCVCDYIQRDTHSLSGQMTQTEINEAPDYVDSITIITLSLCVCVGT